MFEVRYADDWDCFFKKLNPGQKTRIMKKIEQLIFLKKIRHLKHGLPFFVVEVGQFRIAFREKENVRAIVFAGNHKQYEEWFRGQ